MPVADCSNSREPGNGSREGAEKTGSAVESQGQPFGSQIGGEGRVSWKG